MKKHASLLVLTGIMVASCAAPTGPDLSDLSQEDQILLYLAMNPSPARWCSAEYWMHESKYEAGTPEQIFFNAASMHWAEVRVAELNDRELAAREIAFLVDRFETNNAPYRSTQELAAECPFDAETPRSAK